MLQSNKKKNGPLTSSQNKPHDNSRNLGDLIGTSMTACVMIACIPDQTVMTMRIDSLAYM